MPSSLYQNMISLVVENAIFWDVMLYGLQEPHGVTSQKMAFFIVTAMKTLNLTI
jgi:hypothetical protein